MSNEILWEKCELLVRRTAEVPRPLSECHLSNCLQNL